MTNEVQPHLEMQMNGRGFAVLPPIESVHGGVARVYESSAAEQPCIWLTVSPRDLRLPTGETAEVPLLLTIESAKQLAEQLMLLAEQHYQLDDEDEETEYACCADHDENPDYI